MNDEIAERIAIVLEEINRRFIDLNQHLDNISEDTELIASALDKMEVRGR